MLNTHPTIVITGGHHTSALPLINKLQSRHWNIIWFGHRHSMWGDTTDSAEYKEITFEGIKFVDLMAGKLYNTFNPLKLIRIPFGFIQALVSLIKVHPVGILSFGGYLAVPTVIAGWFLGIPSITHEQTVSTGYANKFISFFVKKIAVSWEASMKHYPKSKVVYTGLPLRSEFISSLKTTRPKEKILYITGGKQGSHLINQAIFSILPELIKHYKVIHQTGSTSLNSDYEQAKNLSKKHPSYHVFDYDSQKAIDALSTASVIVSRAGAHIVYELGLLATPCVLIPLPNSSHNEQLKNAQILEAHHQATILLQSSLTPQLLLTSINATLTLHPTPMTLPLDADSKLITLVDTTFNQKFITC